MWIWKTIYGTLRPDRIERPITTVNADYWQGSFDAKLFLSDIINLKDMEQNQGP